MFLTGRPVSGYIFACKLSDRFSNLTELGKKLYHVIHTPTPMTLASGGSPMFPLVVHQPASPSSF